MRIGIIGKGHVGSALAQGLTKAGHEIRFGHRDPNESVQEAVKWGEVIILAVPYGSVEETVREIGSEADAKVVIDVTNPLGPNRELTVGFETSGSEDLQRMLPRSLIVKAFNTVFAQTMSKGRVGRQRLTTLVGSDNTTAKDTAIRLATDIGFDAVYVGPLRFARYVEPMAALVIGLGYGQNLETNIGFKLVRTAPKGKL
jgi:predicted dinucleotide-binding enzyme